MVRTPWAKKTKSLSTYLGPLVDQLLQLEEGVECYHSDTRERFKLKARCVCDILDYKGQQMFLNTLGQNAFQGCKKSQQPGTYLPILVKVVYTDSRRFLLINHPLRSESGPIFPHGGEEIRPPPKTVVPATPVWCWLWKGKSEWRQQHYVTRQGEINWFEKFAAFDRLPYFDAISDVVTEAMHMIPRIGLLLVQLLTGVVPMDNWKVRIQEEDFGWFGEEY